MAMGTDGLRGELGVQRDFLKESVPAYARLLEWLPDLLERHFVERLSAAWAGRTFGAVYERPVLLLAALRYASLCGGADHPLFAGLVEPADASALSVSALSSALDDERFWHAVAARRVQTNEVSRAVCWVWVAALRAQVEPDVPVNLFDVGASAGLTLSGDRLEPYWRDSQGSVWLSGMPLPPIRARVGFEKHPVNLDDEDDVRWLEACIWPGQQERIHRFARALAAYRSLAHSDAPIRVECASVGEVAARIQAFQGSAIAYQTIVRDYLEPDERERYVSDMRRWLRAHPVTANWVELELPHDGQPAPRSCAITVHVADWSGLVHSFELARCHPHPDVLDVDEAQVQAFRTLISTS